MSDAVPSVNVSRETPHQEEVRQVRTRLVQLAGTAQLTPLDRVEYRLLAEWFQANEQDRHDEFDAYLDAFWEV